MACSIDSILRGSTNSLVCHSVTTVAIVEVGQLFLLVHSVGGGFLLLEGRVLRSCSGGSRDCSLFAVCLGILRIDTAHVVCCRVGALIVVCQTYFLSNFSCAVKSVGTCI